MSTPSVRPQSVDISHVTFTDLKANGHGRPGNSAFLNFKNGRLRVRTDAMVSPFGISVANREDVEGWLKSGMDQDEINSKKKFNMSVNIPDASCGHQNDGHFRTMLNSLDDLLLSHAMDKKYFPQTKSLDGYTAVQTRGVKIALDKETGEPKAYPNTFRCNVPRDFDTREFLTMIFEKDRSQTPLTIENIETLIPSKSTVRLVLECKGIYKTGMAFGLTWNVVQIQVIARAVPDTECAFSDDEDEDGSAVAGGGTGVSLSTVGDGTSVVDSDDEDENEIGDKSDQDTTTVGAPETESEETVQETEPEVEESSSVVAEEEDTTVDSAPVEVTTTTPSVVVSSKKPTVATLKTKAGAKGKSKVNSLLQDL